MLLHRCLLAIPRTVLRTTVSHAETLLEQQCCRWGRAQPHCTARNHLGWCSGWLCYGVHKPVCSPLAFLQAAGLRGSWAELLTQLLDRGDRQRAGEVAADIGSGFPILPLQGCKERQLAVQEPRAVSICDHQHLPREGAERVREHSQPQPAGPPCPTDRAEGWQCPSTHPPKMGRGRGAEGTHCSPLPESQTGHIPTMPVQEEARWRCRSFASLNHTRHLADRVKHRDQHIPA